MTHATLRSLFRPTRLQLTLAATAPLAAACGGGGEKAFSHPPLDPSTLDLMGVVGTNGMSTNGMSTNGMSTNGMSTNGMSTNGMSTNGLTAQTLSTPLFGLWFALAPDFASMVMSYVVKGAYADGTSLDYSTGGATYSWPGELGLAPAWSAGGPIPLKEQQLVSACLAAHTNKFGVHVEISVRGHRPDGSLIPMTAAELSSYTTDEGCFFGNLFDGTGVFSAWSSNSPLAKVGQTSLRACAADNGQPGSCWPMVSTGKTCQAICSTTTTDLNKYWAFKTCSWNGKSWPVLSVRLTPAEVASCGDGICQDSESCYSLSAKTGCRECGTCK